MSSALQVPHFDRADEKLTVTHWGAVAGFVLRPGDLLVVGPEEPGALLALVPRGYGRPMVARRVRGKLQAEPTGVPASADRWAVLGAIVSVERDLERGACVDARWCVAARTRALGDAPAVAREAFEGQDVSSDELDARCLRAAVAPGRWETEVALAAAATMDEAVALLEGTPFGRIRYATVSHGRPLRHAAGAETPTPAPPRGVVLPFRPAPERQLSLFG
jgi:hypothetical protein